MALFIGFGTLYRALVQPWLLRAGENIARFGCAALGGRRWRRSLMHGAAGVGHRRSSGGSPPRARSSPRSYSSSGCCPSTSHPSYSTSSGARTSPTKVGPPAGLQRPRSDTATSSAAYLVVHGEAVVTIHFREVLRCALVGARVPTVPGPSTPLQRRPLSRRAVRRRHTANDRPGVPPRGGPPAFLPALEVRRPLLQLGALPV